MKTNLTLISTILVSTFALAACGGGGGSGGSDGEKNAAPTDGTTDNSEDGQGQPATIDCETQWQRKVASAPVGQVKAHDTLVVTTGSGDLGLDGTVRSRSRETITSATDEAIVIATEWEYFQPALGKVDGETRLTKENFLFSCEPMVEGSDEADPEGLRRAGVTILADRIESVTVKAGTFSAQYLNIHVNDDDGGGSEVLSDHWTINDETVVVKEKMVVTSAVEGGSMVRTTTRELIDYVAGR